MTIRRRTLVFLALAFCVWAIIATGFAGYYQIRYTKVTKAFEEIESSIIEVDVLIDYGNGTQVWHNETRIVAGSTVLDALLAITTDVKFETSPGWGAFVTAISGVENFAQGNTGSAWMWYYWDAEKSEWVLGSIAVDQHVLSSNDAIAWHYESYSF